MTLHSFARKHALVFFVVTCANAFKPSQTGLGDSAKRWSWRASMPLSIGMVMLCACTQATTWQSLLSAKISEQYPDYKVQVSTGGSLLVERPGKSTLPVDAEAIGRFCQRGPRDCNYATDQMLLELGGK